jgi:hypothetical protein
LRRYARQSGETVKEKCENQRAARLMNELPLEHNLLVESCVKHNKSSDGAKLLHSQHGGLTYKATRNASFHRSQEAGTSFKVRKTPKMLQALCLWHDLTNLGDKRLRFIKRNARLLKPCFSVNENALRASAHNLRRER